MKHMMATGMSQSLRETLVGAAIDGGLITLIDGPKIKMTDLGVEIATKKTSMEFAAGEEFPIGCDRLSYVLSKIYLRG